MQAENPFLMLTLCFDLFLQTDRGPARRGAHIPNIRSENWKENFFLVCTSTKRSACNCHGCSTSPTDKWRSGFKTVAWRRKSWTETGYSITHPTLSFRAWKAALGCRYSGDRQCFTDSCCRTLCSTDMEPQRLLGGSGQAWRTCHLNFPNKKKKQNKQAKRNEHEFMWTYCFFFFIFRPCFREGKVYWILSWTRRTQGALIKPLNTTENRGKSAVTKTDPMYFVIKRFIWPLFCFKIRNVGWNLSRNESATLTIILQLTIDNYIYWCDQIMLPKG